MPTGLLQISIAALACLCLLQGKALADMRSDFSTWLTNWSLDLGASASLDRWDAARSDIRIQGLVLESRRLEFALTIGAIQLRGVNRLQGIESIIAAEQLEVSDLVLRFGDLELASDILVMEEVTLPRLPTTPQVGASLFERKFAFANRLLGLTAKSIKSDRLHVHSYGHDSDKGRLATSEYADVLIENIGQGVIGTALTRTSISASPPVEPMLREVTGIIQLKGLNLKSYLSLLDGQANSTIAPLLEELSLSDYRLDFGGIQASIGQISLGNMTLGRTSAELERQILSTFESDRGLDALSEDKRAAFLLDMLTLPGIGRLRLEQVRAQTLGIEELRLDVLDLTEFSTRGLKGLRLEDFRTHVRDLGDLSLVNFSINEFSLPDIATIKRALSGAGAPLTALIPTLGGLGLEQLNASLSMGTTTLNARLETALFGFKGARKTTLISHIDGLSLPVVFLPSGGPLGSLREVLAAQGQNTISLSHKMSLTFDDNANRLIIEDLTVDSDGLAQVALRGALEGLTTSPFKAPEDALAAIRTGRLSSFQIDFANSGVVETAFDVEAARLNTDGETLRNQVGATLPFLLGVLQNPPFQQQLAATLRSFLPKPEGLRLTANPATALPLADLERQLRRDPRQLISRLGLSVENRPFTDEATEQDQTPPAPQSPN